jgi:hypothetical protein
VIAIAVTAASFAGFALIFTVFAKLFPMVSVWEIEDGWGHTAEPITDGAAHAATASTVRAGSADD